MKLIIMLLTSKLLYLTFISNFFGNATERTPSTVNEEECSWSSEATKERLFDHLKKIQKRYYELKPYLAATNYDYSGFEVKKFYRPYVPTPTTLKRDADEANRLLKSLGHLKINHTRLKPREERLVHQFRYFLKSNFDNIYEAYYDGIFMLGPDYFCEQAICMVGNFFEAALRRMRNYIKSVKDLKDLISLVRDHKQTFEVYLKNVQQGPPRGMVHSKEVCKAASKTFAKLYRRIKKDPTGVLKMDFAKILMDTDQKYFYKNLSESAFDNFKAEHNRSYADEMRAALIDYIGKPAHALVKYLREEHWQYCPSSETSSGLGGLPLEYVFKNESKTDTKTNTTLPELGATSIDVDTGYRKLLWYYTTSNVSASEAFDLGRKLIKEYYEQVVDLAKNITKENNTKEAVAKFKKMIKSTKYNYNEEPFPENESDDEAHERCDNDEDAMVYCPERWRIFEKWKSRNIDIMNEAKPYISKLFHESGDRKTTPDCLVKLVADYDPTNGVPSYMESDPMCTQPASYYIPFFKNDMGPDYDDYNTNFHEARPGHHLQIQGYLENFMDECGDIAEWINDVVDYYPSFSEGWGLYAENPLLLKDTGILDKENIDHTVKYGALKWQIWRALRLVVDVGFHTKNITRNQALKYFRKYTWDDSDTVEKELTRYQGTPGQATSYTLGQQSIIRLRNRTETALGKKFNIKDFHYELLSLGQAPFDYSSAYINNYIKCQEDKSSSMYCGLILGAKESAGKKRSLIEKRSPRRKLIAEIFRSMKRRKPS